MSLPTLDVTWAIIWRLPFHQSSGSCSDHPGRGAYEGCSTLEAA